MDSLAAGQEQGSFWRRSSRGRRVVVEELDSDEDSDTQGAGLISATGTRFASDPLHFTGIDLGQGLARRRRSHGYEYSEDEDDSEDSEQDTELEDEGQLQLSSRDNEEELVSSAMRRIRRAQASGKEEVRLSKKELAALESWRRRKHAGGEKKKKKKKEQRYAVPLSQLAPASHKESRSQRPPVAMPSVESLDRSRGLPPVGWFAHPASSRPGTAEARQPSGRQSDRESSTSPFQYAYVQHPGPTSNLRHISDPALRPRSTRGPSGYEDARMAQFHPSSSVPSVPATLDPFRYMTSGSNAPYHAGSSTSLGNIPSSPRRDSYYESSARGASSASRRQSRHFTPDDNESSSASSEDDSGDETSEEVIVEGARVESSASGASMRGGREQIVVEVAREPTPEPRVTRSRKAAATASTTSSPKRKPVGSGTSRRKKGR